MSLKDTTLELADESAFTRRASMAKVPEMGQGTGNGLYRLTSS